MNNIFGWFDFLEVYSKLVEECPDGGTLIEVGSWRGKSTRYLSEKIKESGKKIEVHAVDLWPPEYEGDVCDSFQEFRNNLKDFDFVHPIISDSSEAAHRFEDKSCFAVFIDASHKYENVVSDIRAWLPKCAKYIAGHDFSEAHPDVERAVREVLGDNFTKLEWSVWIHEIK